MSEQSELWRWRSEGHTYGPVDTPALHTVISHGKLPDDAEVQLVGSGEWMSAGEVKSLFAELDSGDTSTAAARAIAKSRRARLTGGETDADNSSVVSVWLSKLVGKIRQLQDAGMSGAAGALEPFLALRKLVNRKLTIVVLIGVLAAVVFRNYSGFHQRRLQTRLEATWQQFQELEGGGDETKLKSFVDSSLAWLRPEVENLKSATESESASQESWIPWVRRDALADRYLYQGAHALEQVLTANDSRAVVEFDRQRREYLKLAEMSIGGEVPSEKVVYSVPKGKFRRETPATFQQPAAKSKQDAAVSSEAPPEENSLVTGVIVVDVLLVAGGAVYWLTRKRS